MAVVTKHVTSDGIVFDDLILAELHEKTLLTTEQQEKVKRVEKALEKHAASNDRITPRDLIRWLAKNWESL